MTTFKSKADLNVPESNLLSYLFDAPYDTERAWPASEPLLLAANDNGATGYSIGQIKSLVKRLGHGLYTLGARDKNVIIYGDANIHFQLAVLGVLAAGATVNIRPVGPFEVLVSRLRQLKCDIVLCGPQNVEMVCAAAAEVGIPKERLFVVDDNPHNDNDDEDKTGKSYSDVKHWSALLSLESPSGDYVWPELSPQESKTKTAFLIDTSGATGVSKLVERDHHGIIGNIEHTLHHFRTDKNTYSHEILFSNFRFCGIIHLLIGLLVPLKARYKSIFPAGPDATTFTETVARMKPTWVMAPKHLMREALAMDRAALDFESVRHALTGGAILPAELVREWQGAFGSEVKNTWGMSEGGTFTFTDPEINPSEEDATAGVMLGNVETKVLDEKGNRLKTNENGTLYVRTPFAMKGYLDDPVKTAETITDDGWIKTDDSGWVDGDERVHIAGRSKDMFKVRGYNVNSSDIETAIMRHPEVKDAAVVPVFPPNDDEQIPRGYIVKNSESNSTLTIDELIAWMETEAHPHLQLTGGASLIESIPISSGGNSKVDRQKLIQIASEEIQTN